jgi:hypothetical protein
MSRPINVKELHAITKDMVENGCGNYIVFGIHREEGPQHFVSHEIDVEAETLDLKLNSD